MPPIAPPSELWLKLASSQGAAPILLGMDWQVARLRRAWHRPPRVQTLLKQAETILNHSLSLQEWSEPQLREALLQTQQEHRQASRKKPAPDAALALICEASSRIRGERPYPTQIASALAMSQGCIVELATGEGKTLSTALAAVLCAWQGKGCHILTANDYLACRDAKEMASLYQICGLQVGAIEQTLQPTERKAQYDRDVTYLTSKEAAADFLRDQLALGGHTNLITLLAKTLHTGADHTPQQIQRRLACALIDEADSVLIDGGSTPLLISQTDDSPALLHSFALAAKLAAKLQPGQDYQLNRRHKEARLTHIGELKLLEACRQDGDWGTRSQAQERLEQALEAKSFFMKDQQYLRLDGKVIIIDEMTGRSMPDHEWRNGMHQAVCAKEGVAIQPPRRTMAQITFQNFFRHYHFLAGSSGTAWETRQELYHFYGRSVVRIPTYRPVQRKSLPFQLLADLEGKLQAIVAEVRAHHPARPLLVGVNHISEAERITAELLRHGLPANCLSANQLTTEAEIISRAGEQGSITVATNMAGRGTDIKISKEVKQNGGLHVILTERHRSARVDRQLRGRSGRQGDPGSCREIISLLDPIFDSLPAPLLALLHQTLQRRRLSPLATWCSRHLLRWLQWYAEHQDYRQRRLMIQQSRQFADMMRYAGKQQR